MKWTKYTIPGWRNILYSFWKLKEGSITYYQRTLKFHKPQDKTYMMGFDHGKWLFSNHMKSCEGSKKTKSGI